MNRQAMRSKAFTLIEAVVLLVVLAVVTAAIAPLALKFAAARKQNATREEMETLHRGIVGDPERGRFGFLGDLGRLPSSLGQLVEPGGLPFYHLNNAYGVGMGWNGPYVHKTKAEATRDAFGREYRYGGGTTPFQIQSAGADGVFDTQDDLRHPPVEHNYFGTVRIELAATGAYTVRLHYSDGGVERYLDADSPPFIFENIHLGPHAVHVFLEDEEGDLGLVHEALINLTAKTGVFMLQF